jgi:endonuclease/exonuclease/phosphatase family metal-dependent hydrolase
VERVKEPVLCMGDFNFYDGQDGRSGELLAEAGLRDAALMTGNVSPTFWPRGESERFDRIYVRDGASASIGPRSLTVLSGKDNPWSDHAPLSAVLDLKT